MNKTTTITLVSIVAILIIGGLIYFANTPPVTTGLGDLSNGTSTNQDNSQIPSRVAGAPTVVTGSKAVPTDTTVVLIGQVNPNGALTSYWYEYGSTSNLGSKSGSQMIGSGFTNFNVPAYIKGLTKNTKYYFQLVAENQYGKISGNQLSFTTTEGVAAPIGSAPLTKTLAASGISRNTANINGEITPNQASTEYWFEYGKTANLGDTSAFASVGNGSAKLSESVSLSNLDALTTYFFRINAQNQFGTVNGSILTFKTTGPVTATAPKVVSQKATVIASSTASLHGSVTPNGAETNYWFEYSTDSGFASASTSKTNEITLGANANTTSVKVDISDLNADTNYYFRLIAKNSISSVSGNSLSFKTSKK